MMTRPIADLNAYELAQLADCGEPANSDSPGAKFLCSMRDALIDAREYSGDAFDPDEDLHELADGAVPVYTYQRWQVFLDLAGWQVDTSDYGDDVRADALTEHAGVVLYVIADALLHALVPMIGGDATLSDE